MITVRKSEDRGKGKIDWNVEIKPGPLEVGFDYAFMRPVS